MGRTSHRRYRRERAAVLAGPIVCWLCGDPIDKSLKWPDPMSASADHQTPWVQGGSDGRANLKPAHLGCNSRRGKRGSGVILKRSGSLD